jgi:putative RNA 2'-phosphotransferase
MSTNPILTDTERLRASQSLCHRLRHNPGLNEFGQRVVMDRAGYVPVADMLNAGILDGWIRDEVEFWDLVEHDGKGRFEFSSGSFDEDEGLQWHLARIRACSGHSLDVDLGLDDYVPAGDLFFGTVDRMTDRILEDGLASGSRRHTRLVETEEAATSVAEQRRGGAPAVFRINAVRMHEDGLRFQMAHNGEVLGPPIPACYIAQVECAPAPGPWR